MITVIETARVFVTITVNLDDGTDTVDDIVCEFGHIVEHLTRAWAIANTIADTKPTSMMITVVPRAAAPTDITG